MLIGLFLASLVYVAVNARTWHELGATTTITRPGEQGFWPSSDGRFVIFAEGTKDERCGSLDFDGTKGPRLCYSHFARNVAYDTQTGRRREFPSGFPLWIDFVMHGPLVANGTVVTGGPENPALVNLGSGKITPLPWARDFRAEVRWGSEVFDGAGQEVLVADVIAGSPPSKFGLNLTKRDYLVAANPSVLVVQNTPFDNESGHRVLSYNAFDRHSKQIRPIPILAGEYARACNPKNCHLGVSADKVIVPFARQDQPPVVRAFGTPSMDEAWNVTLPPSVLKIERLTTDEHRWVAHVLLEDDVQGFAYGATDGTGTRLVTPKGGNPLGADDLVALETVGYDVAITAGSGVVVSPWDDGSLTLARPGKTPWTLRAAVAFAASAVVAAVATAVFTARGIRSGKLCKACHAPQNGGPFCQGCGSLHAGSPGQRPS